MAQADGSVIIDTRMNNDALEKGFERLKTDAESLGITFEKAGDKIKAAFADYDVSANIQNAVAKLQEAQNKLQTATDYFNDAVAMDDDKSAEMWARKREAAYAQVEAAQRRLTQVIASEANKQAADEEKAQAKTKNAVKRAVAAEERAQVQATKVAEREAEKKKKAHEKAINDATKGIRRFASRFSRILSGALIFNTIRSGLNQLTSYFGTALKKNAEFSESFSKLKGAFLTAVQPIYEVVAPALTYLMNLLTKAMQGVSRLFSLLTGKSTSQMAENAKDLYDQAKATEEVGNAAEKAKKSLAGFDEINRLDDKSSSGGGGSSESTEIGATFEQFGDVPTIFDDLKSKLSEYANLFQPTFDAWKSAFSGFSEAIAPSIETIKTSFSNLWEGSLKPFAGYVMEDFVPSISNSISENLAPMFSDVLTTAVQGFAIDFENQTLVIQECLGWVQTGLEQIKIVFNDMCVSIKENWDEYGGSIMDGILEFKEGLWETFWNIYNEIIKPVLEKCSEMFSWLWDKHLKPLWDNIVEFVTSTYDNILALWNKTLKPIIDWLVTIFGPSVSSVIGGIIDAVSIVIAFISDIVGAILEVLDGIITFLVGVFTLDWKRAWNGIKKIFSGVWDALVGIVKGVVNSIIWVINKLISIVYSAVAGVVNGLGSLVGALGDLLGLDWGFSIPSQPPAIPYLAQGAVLPANKPFLAMVGDQKNGTNVEAPLSTIQEAVREELTAMFGDGFGVIDARLLAILEAIYGIDTSDERYARAVSNYNRRAAIMGGI